jgi:DNA-binding transcriptional MerR regulator
MAIDTLKIARRLREAGFSEPQAEAVVAAVQQGSEGADFAVKSDLAVLGAELRAEMAALRGEMREMEQRLIARIEAVKSEILGRMFAMILSAVLINIIAIVGAMFALVKLVGH